MWPNLLTDRVTPNQKCDAHAPTQKNTIEDLSSDPTLQENEEEDEAAEEGGSDNDSDSEDEGEGEGEGRPKLSKGERVWMDGWMDAALLCLWC